MRSVYLYTDSYLSVEEENGQLTFKIQKYGQREFDNNAATSSGDDNAADGQLVAQWMDNGDTERELQE